MKAILGGLAATAGRCALLALGVGCAAAHAQSAAQLQEQLRQLQQQMEGAGLQQYRDAMRQLDEANRAAGAVTGTRPASIQPAATPDAEMARRREIINSQYRQARAMLGSLPAGADRPQIVEAVAVEGQVVVEGGAREQFYNQLKTDLQYTVREAFVGNLMVLHSYDPRSGRFLEQKDYELESLSTEIRVPTVMGKQCTRWSSGSPQVCTRWANFFSHEVDEGERYPAFSAEVVNASTLDEGRIEIEASAARIDFPGNDHVTRLTSGCTGGRWTLSRAEFETLFERGEIVLRQEIGRSEGPAPGCRAGSTLTLYLRLAGKAPPTAVCEQAPDVRIQIVKPEQQSRHVFSDEYALPEHSNRLALDLEARVEPARLADSIEWIVPEMPGSTRSTVPASASLTPRGARLQVIYQGLPEDYKAFGPKTVTARVQVGACSVEDSREVKLFYPRDAMNNPEGKYRNWFYYWRQTPAALPMGQNVRLEFGGTAFDLCAGEHVMAIYKPDHLYKAIHICDFTAKLDRQFALTVPRVSRGDRSTLETYQLFTFTHIDTFAVIVLHEFAHFNHHHTWWSGKSDEQRAREDVDGDGVPDRLEHEMGFVVPKFQTFWGDHEDFRNINGDEEFLAYETAYDYPVGKFDEYDWGKPGKNWMDD